MKEDTTKQYNEAHYRRMLRAAEKEEERLSSQLLAAKLDELEALLAKYRASVYKVKQLKERLEKPHAASSLDFLLITPTENEYRHA